MTKIYRLLLMAFVVLLMTGCEDSTDVKDVDLDEMFSAESVETEETKVDAMQVKSVKFTPDHKHFSIQTSIIRDLGPYALADTNRVTIKATESIGGLLNESKSKPVLVAVKNSEAEEVSKMGIKLLVLVDLAQPQIVIEKERDAVREIRAVFSHNNLFVSFMYGQNVSETMEASDYVLDNYFTSQSDQYKYLYRAILLKKHEMEDHYGVWADTKRMSMLVFSDEVVYGDEDKPVDPTHFQLQSILVNADSIKDPDFSIIPVCFKEHYIDDDSQAKSVLKVLAKNTGGVYMNRFNWREIKGKVLNTNQDIIANEFEFENPDGKIYRGIPHHMRIEIHSKESDSIIGAASTNMFLGSAYNPIIVNGYSDVMVFLQGLGLGLLIMMFVYLVFQFIVPYIRYRIFKKNYVVKYMRGSMSVGNVMVTEKCYFCKAPFEEGEEIVAKCNHVMHKSCWDENGYHCPEHGRHCDTGSHYYNYKNLFDMKNASFYMKWVLIAIAAAIISWLVYLIYVTDYDAQQQQLVARMAEARLSEMGSSAIFNDGNNEMDYTPIFGLILGFILTLALSIMAVRRQQLKRRLLDIFLRATIVGVASYFVFMFFHYMAIALNLRVVTAIIDVIPWTLCALMIVFVSTVGTRIRLRKYVFAIAVAIGILSMYLWSYIVEDLTQLDIRVLLMFTCILLSVGLAVSVAEVAPKSERYFLNIKGAVKEMDVALFKWFISDPNTVVTIGKSIDCSLQLSWDLKGNVAPIHAELRMSSAGNIHMTALEEGVMVDEKPLAVGKSIELFHNTSFTIGDTTFTYIERDI